MIPVMGGFNLTAARKRPRRGFWQPPVAPPPVSGDSYPEPPVGPWRAPNTPTRMPNFTYEGSWRLHKGTWKTYEDMASTRGHFHVMDDGVWVTNHVTKDKAVVKFSKPTPVMTDVVSNIPIASPITDYLLVPGHDSTGIKPYLAGVYYDDVTSRLIVTQTVFYGVTGEMTTHLQTMDQDGGNKSSWFDVTHQRVSCGKINKTPDHLVDQIGRLYMKPESHMAIVGHYCLGPGIYGWDGALPETDGSQIPMDPIMYYRMDTTLGDHSAGSCSRPAHPIFHRLVRYYVTFFWGGSLIVIGSTAGQEGGMSYGIPPYGGNKGNYTCIKGDYDNYYWIWDANEVLTAENPWSTRPKEFGFLSEFADRPGLLINADFDPITNKLYLMDRADNTQNADNNYPIIHQYQVS